MKLPKGVTGFRRSMRAPPLPETDVRAFRSHCYAAARAAGGVVLGFEEPYRYANNFAACTIRLPSGPVAVLLNAHFPLLGLALPPADGEIELRFADAPALAAAFREFGGYEVLDRTVLEGPLTDEAAADLAGEIKHPQSVRLGDVVFNSWD